MRKNIYNTTRRLEAAFQVDFGDHSEVKFHSEGMRLLFELHQKRWQRRGFPGTFAKQESRDFNLDIAKVFSEKKWLSLFVLTLSGEPAAALYGFKYRSKGCEYVSGLEPKYSKYSVGNVLRAHVIAKLIREGILEYDFLRGAEEYKARWNATSRWNYQAVLARKGFFSDIRNWVYDEYWHQGGRLKYLLRKQS